MREKEMLELLKWANIEVRADMIKLAAVLFRCCMVLMPDDWGTDEFKSLFVDAMKVTKGRDNENEFTQQRMVNGTK